MALDTALLAPLLAHLDCPAAVLNADQRMVLYNAQLANLWSEHRELPAEQPPMTQWLAGLCAAGVLEADAPEVWRDRWQALLASEGELTLPSPQGRLQCRVSPLPGGWLVLLTPAQTVRDASYFRSMVECLHDAVYVCSADHHIEYANSAMRRWVGPDPEGRLCHQAIYGRDTPCPWCTKEHLLAHREPNRMETQTPDGRSFSVTNAPLENPDGSLSKLAIYRDITGEKVLHTELAESREFAEALVANSAVATFVLDTDHRVRLWNRACAELTGVASVDLLGTRDHWRAFYPEPRYCLADYVLDGTPPPLGDIYDRWGPSTLVPDALHGERWVRRPDGDERYLAFEASPIRDRYGVVVAVIETLHDLTARRRAEEQSRLLTSAVGQTTDGIALCDATGRLIYANPAFLAAVAKNPYAKNPEPAPGHLPLPEDPTAAQALTRALSTGRHWRGRDEHETADGAVRTEEWSVAPIVAADAGPCRSVIVRRDVSREREVERNLARAQQLEAVGTLASGIAHDFNNLLAGIMGHAEVTLDDVPAGSTSADNLGRILRAGERGQHLVQQLLAFSRQGEAEQAPVSLTTSVEEALGLLRAVLPPTVELRARLDAPHDIVRGNATQLQQALMNLCTNAAHAMSAAGGVVEVGLESVSVGEEPAARQPDLTCGEYLRLTVSDTGHGIAPEILGRIYEPFFTTKPVGQGTGLGLSATHGIVRSHGGAIRVFSAPGEGTTFHLFFPACGASTPERIEPSAQQVRVLFVDDEPDVVDIGKQTLAGLGYRVTATTSSAEALRLLEQAPHRFDVLVSDHAMPGLTGLQLTEAARKLRPDLPVVLCTGYSQARTRERATELGVACFLLKPITVDALDRAIRRALDGQK